MNILIVKAHPSSKGFTHGIAQTYQETKEQKGDLVKVIDLYDDKKENNYLSFEEIAKDFPNTVYIKKQKELVTWADEIIFVFPMWNSAEPAILKNWYDVVFSARFAFRYVKGKMAPLPMLEGKKAKIFVTADGPSWFYTLIANPLKRIWTTTRLHLCGVKVDTFIIFDNMRVRDVSSREQLLRKVVKLAKK
jgi:NAD(P)H dehydrogenase (quinone)